MKISKDEKILRVASDFEDYLEACEMTYGETLDVVGKILTDLYQVRKRHEREAIREIIVDFKELKDESS